MLKAFGAAVAFSTLALACSDPAPGDDTYANVYGDVTDEGAVLTADWSCLGDAPPPPPQNYPSTVTYTFPMTEWVTNTPLPGRTITVCNRIDPDCMTPLDFPTVVEDGVADVSVDLPAGQNVFLVLDAPNTVRTLLYFDGPLYEDQRGGVIPKLRPEVVGSLAAQTSLPLNPALGVVSMRAHDCNGTIVGGALYSITEGMAADAIPYTFVQGQPRSLTPSVTSTSTTIPSDNTPWAGWVNVTPSPAGITVRGVLADAMREFGTADAPIRAQAVSAIEIRPLNHL